MMRQPSMMAATAALSITALFFSLGGGSWAANGAAFVLGIVNSATARTFLGANYNGTAMQLSNTNAGGSATALTLTTAATRPPMAVNSTVKVAKLNADYVDGLDSTSLTRVKRVAFNLAPSASSAPIALPVSAPAKLVAGVTQAPSHDPFPDERGFAEMTFVSAGRIQWQGLEWRSGTWLYGQVTSAAGTHMIWIDRNGEVELAFDSANKIKVVNHSTDQVGGTVTVLW